MQCSKSDLTDRTLTQLFGEQGVCKIGFIEAGCTDSRVALARTHLVSQFNIPQVKIILIWHFKCEDS